MRRLWRPTLRALGWLGVVAAIALGLAVFADVHALWERVAAAPDMWLAVFGSAATAVLAAIAAFELKSARCAARLGLVAATWRTPVGHSERFWLPARLVLAGYSCRCAW